MKTVVQIDGVRSQWNGDERERHHEESKFRNTQVIRKPFVVTRRRSRWCPFVFRPAIIREGDGVISARTTYRASSGDNASTTGKQSRRMGANRVRLKTSPRSFCVTMAATVSPACVMAKGVTLVACEPNGLEKLRSLSERNDSSKAGSNPLGVTVCNRAEPKKLSVQVSSQTLSANVKL